MKSQALRRSDGVQWQQYDIGAKKERPCFGICLGKCTRSVMSLMHDLILPLLGTDRYQAEALKATIYDACKSLLQHNDPSALGISY